MAACLLSFCRQSFGLVRFSSTLLCFKFTFLFFFKVFLLQWLLCAPMVHCQPRHKAFKGVPEQNIGHYCDKYHPHHHHHLLQHWHHNHPLLIIPSINLAIVEPSLNHNLSRILTTSIKNLSSSSLSSSHHPHYPLHHLRHHLCQHHHHLAKQPVRLNLAPRVLPSKFLA